MSDRVSMDSRQASVPQPAVSAAGAAPAAFGTDRLAGKFSRLEDGGAVWDEGGSSGGGESDLVSHSSSGFRSSGKKGLRQFLRRDQSAPRLRRQSIHLRRNANERQEALLHGLDLGG